MYEPQPAENPASQAGDFLDTSTWVGLHPNVQKLWRVWGLLTPLFLAIPVGFFEWFVLRDSKRWLVPEPAIAAGILVFGIIYGQIMVGRRYRNYRYLLGEEDLRVSYGVAWKTWRFIARNRVQHVDVTAGPIARALGLVEVSVFVGGLATAAVTIPGLEPHVAETLRQRLVAYRQPEPPSAPAEPTSELPPTLGTPPPEVRG